MGDDNQYNTQIQTPALPSLAAHLIVLPSLPFIPNGIFLLSRDSVSSVSFTSFHGTLSFTSTSASSRHRIARVFELRAPASLPRPIRLKVDLFAITRLDKQLPRASLSRPKQNRHVSFAKSKRNVQINFRHY